MAPYLEEIQHVVDVAAEEQKTNENILLPQNEGNPLIVSRQNPDLASAREYLVTSGIEESMYVICREHPDNFVKYVGFVYRGVVESSEECPVYEYDKNLIRLTQGYFLLYSEETLYAAIQSLITPVSILHRKDVNIIHRDIKPSNYFFHNMLARLGDHETITFAGDKMQVKVGSESFVHPDMFRHDTVAKPEHDIYGLSCTLRYFLSTSAIEEHSATAQVFGDKESSPPLEALVSTFGETLGTFFYLSSSALAERSERNGSYLHPEVGEPIDTIASFKKYIEENWELIFADITILKQNIFNVVSSEL